LPSGNGNATGRQHSRPGRTTTHLKVDDEACGASALVTNLSPLRVRLSFSKRRYAEVELKAVPGTAEIANPGATH
jgi:hypothetical protein